MSKTAGRVTVGACKPKLTATSVDRSLAGVCVCPRFVTSHDVTKVHELRADDRERQKKGRRLATSGDGCTFGYEQFSSLISGSK